MALAQRTALALEAEHTRNGTQVVLLGRAGQDLTAYGLRYSHLGWPTAALWGLGGWFTNSTVAAPPWAPCTAKG